MREAIGRALANEDLSLGATRWSDALGSTPLGTQWGGTRFGSRIVATNTLQVAVPPEAAFTPIRRIGGRNGWYHANWLWRLRGWIDLLFGDPGMRRGRRDLEHLLPGDALDWWRVESIEPDRTLRLAAEMRLPGRAWLQFEVTPDGAGGAIIWQTALFDPVGLLGIVYWYGLWPLHRYVFSGMMRAIGRRAEVEARGLPR